MISKAKSIRGSTQAIDYILNDKGQAVELDRNGVAGQNGKEILSEFRMVQAENKVCNQNTISIVLSPDSEQGKYSEEKLRAFLHKHLDNLGLRDNQWIASVHNSTDNQHIHIIANRINTQGKALDDSFISKKAQSSAEAIAKEYGLATANEISLSSNKNTKELRKQINQSILECKAKSRSFEEFSLLMKGKGYEVKPTYNKSGVMFGMRIENGGHSFKLSEINRQIKHYHFADILPRETLLKASDLQRKTTNKSSSLLQNAIVNQVKTSLGKEAQDVFKAFEIVSSLKLDRLVINSAKEIIKGINRSRGMSM
jgi:hypothetical protein